MSLDTATQQHPPPSSHPSGNNNTLDDILSTITPREGRLIPLRTKAEVEHSDPRIIQAYSIEIPQNSAHEILKAVDILLRDHQNDINPSTQPTTHLPHLRRLIKPSALPSHLHPINPPPNEPTLHLLIPPIPSLPLPTLQSTLSNLLPPTHPPAIHKIDIPLYAPISEAQAQEWTRRFWPCVYRNHNPWGPQPSEIAKGEERLRGCVGRTMALARDVGREVGDRGVSVGVGAVVVDEGGRVVVGAGDARWMHAVGDKSRKGNGDPTAHAVMRAIAMVARKRREVTAAQEQSQTDASSADGMFLSHGEEQRKGKEAQQPTPPDQDKPITTTATTPTPTISLTPLEKNLYNASPLRAGGYLCLDLRIFITHEPCVMCSMAILQSRFSGIVFGRRMRRTGGVSAEVGCIEERIGEQEVGKEEEGERGTKKRNGYGLFWRPELNWRMLGWRWDDDEEEVDEQEEGYGCLSEDTHI